MARYLSMREEAFVIWMNDVLGATPPEVGEVARVAQLADGLVLPGLVEALGVAKGVRFHPPPLEPQAADENLTLALEALSRAGLDHGLDAAMLAEAETKSLLSLLWLVVAKFHVGAGMDADFSASRATAIKAVTSRLLKWVSATAAHMASQGEAPEKASNFSSCFQNGRLLALLLEATAARDPALAADISLQLYSSPASPAIVAQLAAVFDRAEAALSIPQVLAPHPTLTDPDPFAIMTYVAYFRNLCEASASSPSPPAAAAAAAARHPPRSLAAKLAARKASRTMSGRTMSGASMGSAIRAARERDALQRRVAVLEAEVEDAHAAAAKARALLEASEAKVADLTDAHQHSVLDDQYTGTSSAQSPRGAASNDDSVSAMQDELQALTDRLLAEAAAEADLQKQLAAAREHMTSSEREMADLASANSELRSALEASHQRRDAVMAELAAYRNRAEKHLASKATLKMQLFTAKSRLAKADEQLAASKALLKKAEKTASKTTKKYEKLKDKNEKLFDRLGMVKEAAEAERKKYRRAQLALYVEDCKRADYVLADVLARQRLDELAASAACS